MKFKNNTMKKSLIILSTLAVMVGTGCKKGYLDINQNPNSPTSGNIDASLILPNALNVSAARATTTFGFAANWIGYWGPSGTYAPNTEESTYNITSNFQTGHWSGWYDNLTDYDNMEKKAASAGQSFYQGIAMLMKANGFMYLVDLYGNVPYSKAFDLANNITPAYDKGQDIYNDLFVKIEQAVDLIKNADVAKNPKIATSDIMFAGDKTLWRKFANTLRLKLLIHQSQISGFNPAAQIAKIAADGSGYLGAGQSASVNPGYLNDNNRQNPFWASYGFLVNGNSANDYYRANNYVLNIYKGNNDIRYQYFFAAAVNPSNPANPYVGVTYGTDPNTTFNSVRTSNMGPGVLKSVSQHQWLLTSVESMFLQAEAIQRGWLPGSAQAAYEAAVVESFSWLGISGAAATAAAYYNDPGNVISNYATVAAGTTDQKVKFIVNQKYLSLCGINNMEAWTDWRRLAVPANTAAFISINPSKVSSTLPVRLMYPQAEYNYNAANVAAEGTINQFTSFLFWDK